MGGGLVNGYGEWKAEWKGTCITQRSTMQKREHVQCPDTERNSGYETVVSNVL